MHARRIVLFSLPVLAGILLLPASSPAASTVTFTVSGTPGPLLAGSDPLNIGGQSASVTVSASESLNPTKQASNFVSYSLPPGAVNISILGINLPSSGNATLEVQLTGKADILTVTAPSLLGTVISMTAFLAPGSWNTSVFKHPTTFSPSPQNLSPAAVAKHAGSQVKYVFLGSESILGFTGTASDSTAGAPVAR